MYMQEKIPYLQKIRYSILQLLKNGANLRAIVGSSLVSAGSIVKVISSSPNAETVFILERFTLYADSRNTYKTIIVNI